jgi:hypothetical protein
LVLRSTKLWGKLQKRCQNCSRWDKSYPHDDSLDMIEGAED